MMDIKRTHGSLLSLLAVQHPKHSRVICGKPISVIQHHSGLSDSSQLYEAKWYVIEGTHCFVKSVSTAVRE